MTRGQWQCMRDVVADKAIAVIEEYRDGRFHGREVSCILAELFEAANDSFERMMLLHGEKSDIVSVDVRGAVESRSLVAALGDELKSGGR